MRFTMLARRSAGAAALGLILAMTAAACSSSSSSPSAAASSPSAPASSSAASSPASPASGSATTLNPAAATSEITANWEKFFDFSTPTSERVTLLQNGSKFASAITSLAKLPLANGIGAKVTKVTVNSPTSATVTYNITAAGSSLLSNQTGMAVYQDGTWKVGDASLCGLFKLVPGGSVPSACSSVG